MCHTKGVFCVYIDFIWLFSLFSVFIYSISNTKCDVVDNFIMVDVIWQDLFILNKFVCWNRLISDIHSNVGIRSYHKHRMVYKMKCAWLTLHEAPAEVVKRKGNNRTRDTQKEISSHWRIRTILTINIWSLKSFGFRFDLL